MKKINIAHQFLAKLIPAINNAKNPIQSMNLIGENFFIQISTFIPQVLTPCLKMDCRSKAARYLEVWGTEFFYKVSVGDSKGTKTSNVIHLLSSKLCFVVVYIIGITYSVDSFQGQIEKRELQVFFLLFKGIPL